MNLKLNFLLPDIKVANQASQAMLLARVKDKDVCFLARPGTNLGKLQPATATEATNTINEGLKGVLMGAGLGLLGGLYALYFPAWVTESPLWFTNASDWVILSVTTLIGALAAAVEGRAEGARLKHRAARGAVDPARIAVREMLGSRKRPPGLNGCGVLTDDHRQLVLHRELVAIFDHFRELVAGIDVHERERHVATKRLTRQPQQHGRVLACTSDRSAGRPRGRCTRSAVQAGLGGPWSALRDGAFNDSARRGKLALGHGAAMNVFLGGWWVRHSEWQLPNEHPLRNPPNEP